MQYAVILLVIFIIQVAIGVYAFLQIKDEATLKRIIIKNIEDDVEKYGKNPVATEYIDLIQQSVSLALVFILVQV